jgi:two-component system, cell cycle response regulator CpdR
LTRLRILYVEDNAHLRETISLLLEAPGREIVPCANAEAALVVCAAERFDVLITDVSLPGMSGTDLARQVLAREAGCWVVLCSGYEFRHGLATIGPRVRSLPKPFEIEELDALMAEITADLAQRDTG